MAATRYTKHGHDLMACGFKVSPHNKDLPWTSRSSLALRLFEAFPEIGVVDIDDHPGFIQVRWSGETSIKSVDSLLKMYVPVWSRLVLSRDPYIVRENV